MSAFAKVSTLLIAAATLPAAAYASAATTMVELTPTADSYVNNASVNQNNGATTSFIANNTGGATNGVRVSFLRFDLSGIDPRTIENVKLDLMVTTAAEKGYNVYALTGAASESWDERTLNWSNAPAVVNSFTTKPAKLVQYLDTTRLHNSGAVLANFTSRLTPGAETVFDVTEGELIDFIKTGSDKTVTFVIAKQDDATGNGTAWSSREAATGKPRLTITTKAPEPMSYALIGACVFGVVVATAGTVVLVRRRRSSAPALVPPPPVAPLPPPPQPE